MLKTVTKRDGTSVPFDEERIERAISAAMEDVGLREYERVRAVKLKVIAELANQPVLAVETIQDEVERALMAYGEYDAAKAYILYRNQKADLRPVSYGDSGISEYIVMSKYSRYRADLGRRELWHEASQRVFDMHRDFYSTKLKKMIPADDFSATTLLSLGDLIDRAQQSVTKKQTLPSMRTMQFGGQAILETNMRSFNCTAGIIDAPERFAQAMWLLLCGCGVGFSVQKHHVAKLPAFPIRGNEDDLPIIHHKVEDTIVGWAESMRALVDSHYNGTYVEFDFSAIRPKGTPLKTSGGKAPGHLPLKKALARTRDLLRGISGRHMRPVEAYDIVMFAASAVISGGIRRSATIALFSADDEEMVNAKTGEWWKHNPQRQHSNNSAMLKRSVATKDEFMSLFNAIREFGEPAFYFTEDYEHLTNPCLTADAWVMTSEGARQVEDLIDTPFTAWVNGKEFDSTDKGFFYTGTKPVVKVSLANGSTLRVTKNHQIAVGHFANGEPIWKEAGELTSKDSVVLHNHRQDVPYWMSYSGTDGVAGQALGYLLGSLKGDGTLQAEGSALLDAWGDDRKETQTRYKKYLAAADLLTYQHALQGTGDTAEHDRCRTSSTRLAEVARDYGMRPYTKSVTPAIESEGADFLTGFLRGWFDTDGSVEGSQQKGVSVRLTSIYEEDLRAAQRILARFGVMSTLYTNRRPAGRYMLPDGNGGSQEYECHAVHQLVIANDSIGVFAQQIGFEKSRKLEALNTLLASYKRTPNASKFYSQVIRVEEDGEEMVFDCTIPGPHAFDANGLYVHNCVEIGLTPTLEVHWGGSDREAPTLDIVSGWAACNLSTINGAMCKTPEDFYEACVQATVIGTLQAGYTDAGYLGEITKQILERDSLLGVSICGILENPQVLLDPAVLRRGAEIVKETNRILAHVLGINPAARTTCVKPEGSASLVLNTGSGIHPRHAKRYFRRVQAARTEPVFNYFRSVNPQMVEPYIMKADTTDVITFPVEAGPNAVVKDDITAIDFLGMVKLVQENWVIPGTAHEKYAPGARHNVSNTVTVRPHEWDDVADFIWENRAYFTGVSILAASGDKDYLQAPNEEVVTADDVRKWNALQARSVDYSKMIELTDTTTLQNELACGGGSCEVI